MERTDGHPDADAKGRQELAAAADWPEVVTADPASYTRHPDGSGSPRSRTRDAIRRAPPNGLRKVIECSFLPRRPGRAEGRADRVVVLDDAPFHSAKALREREPGWEAAVLLGSTGYLRTART